MPQHIETSIISRPLGAGFGRMYSMHKYWSKKSADVVAAYIERYTKPGDSVLDPFCGYGITAAEAIRLGRRAVAVDINPMATFITKVMLTPVTLLHLRWAFRDVQSACEEAVSELFTTRCSQCGQRAVIDFVVRDNDIPVQMGYTCGCAGSRLFKDPDEMDRRLERSIQGREIPFWYPENIPLPPIRREKFKYLHELFTRRNLIALSMIFNSIEGIEDTKVRSVMSLAFTAALDKCSRLKPFSRPKSGGHPTLQEGWTAVRFYAPKMSEEVNPWFAFARSFQRVYEGKEESNTRLGDPILGSC
mgnify:CR=1 FL=1